MVLLLGAPGAAGAATAPAATAIGIDDFGDELVETGALEGEFSFEGDKPAGTVFPMACPEVRNPAKYKITYKAKHIKARPAVSDWLYPGDSITYETTSQYTFKVDVTAGAEAEAGIVLAKAKTKIDVSISNSWTSTVGITRKSHNLTDKGYRAVLGNRGVKVTYTKTKIVAPCNVKKTTGVIIYPREGDLTFGRYSS